MSKNDGGITSPEGVLMLCVAGILDSIGLIILCFGLDDVGILDITGLCIITSWLFMRTGRISVTKDSQKILKKIGLTTIIEIIPWLGGLAPSWTILVWKEMRGKNSVSEEKNNEDKQNNQQKSQIIAT